MRRAQGSSIHSMASEGGESLISNEVCIFEISPFTSRTHVVFSQDHQLTVRQRGDGEEEGPDKKSTLANLFRGQ